MNKQDLAQAPSPCKILSDRQTHAGKRNNQQHSLRTAPGCCYHWRWYLRKLMLALQWTLRELTWSKKPLILSSQMTTLRSLCERNI